MSQLTRLFVHEWKLFFRDPTAAILGFAFPPALLVIFGMIPMFRDVIPEAGGVRLLDLYVPIMIAIALATVAINTLPAVMATYREKGILRRLSTTPVSPLSMLLAQLLVNMAVALASIAVVIVVARFAFDSPLPANPLGLVLVVVLLAVSLFGIGLLVCALAPNSRMASGVATFIYFPVMFFAGVWAPRDTMSDLLRTISDLTPIGAGVQLLQDTYQGGWPVLGAVAVVVAYGVVLIGIAAKTFRWD
ncbi:MULTISPECIES: ABC transporter permease [Actinoalloteichus]|uniref:Transport permease protein n=1 Tax=Actinoalloteichus fjordicus TaxID=1612552 RepID=A0AAC9LIB8_9PSEU|nr:MULTISPECIES: ABC transporter permease [Actinoalloteichus]APU16900.1 ABC-type multidrug transport system, permease component [Actinoalloteichus fjordicus]APU22980.1 ABC-type multidrug transport system, permease component [Actinoalloteichus sp. GBA129-24]